MFAMAVPWWEFVVRGLIVYAFLLVFLRLTGKRNVGQYDPFDLILLLILSNAVQNSMNAGDNSLTGGLISATTLIAAHTLMAHLTYRSRLLSRLIDGKPLNLITNGKVNQATMAAELLTADDLKAALHAGGCLHTYEVELATIETNGEITIVMRNRDSASKDGMSDACARLGQASAR
ncbi:DUF421 domain-containing protein [Diaphorobacter aerolatus]|uniref:DUF421 domain-containing protein n=1 Tax=Diaphorobacter aerolatus TaxID=1288495 RepID=A0A7H0GHB9_9BURK|nr:YetF domain-containing protein [Diaphorobacter aerolatus]QNP47685.1 DUF421 domain-containing protein [Diaphorobacter aerolatus]